ncbi:pyridoxamine 5'-phosphate oxidase family protein [Actinoplanes sp. NPDC049265]|uniref:pyridoxamine 5'-phosphate oxidase family protein n=1 Tax=Actinoplanes sp. NPDC049265 TaxID=3363902 RepID=UPI00371C086D
MTTWLEAPAPTGRLARDVLEERISQLLQSQNMCVLATSGPGGPLATPVRYYPYELAVMFTAAPRSPKMRNIAADPRVSVGVFAPLAGLASSRGAQLFGPARVFPPDDPSPVRDRYWQAFRWENEHVERGRRVTEPPRETLVVVVPERIVYTEHWLRRDGYAPRQFWHASSHGDSNR